MHARVKKTLCTVEHGLNVLGVMEICKYYNIGKTEDMLKCIRRRRRSIDQLMIGSLGILLFHSKVYPLGADHYGESAEGRIIVQGKDGSMIEEAVF